MNILVSLDSNVEGFSFTEYIYTHLVNHFPSHTVKKAHSKQDVLENLPECTHYIGWIFKKEWYDIANNLDSIFTPAAGRDWIAPPPSTNHTTIHHGTFHGDLMGESLLSMILYFNRNHHLIVQNKVKRMWDRNIQTHCRRLTGQKILIIGYGNIGNGCAKFLHSFGCSIRGVKRNTPPTQNNPWAEIVSIDKLMNSLPWADHIVSLLPGNESTNNFFTKAHFKQMNRSAFFYNLGRGNSYIEGDLIEALTKEEISGAGLDVFAQEPLDKNSKLWSLDNVFITPHSSAIFQEYKELFFGELVKKLQGSFSVQ